MGHHGRCHAHSDARRYRDRFRDPQRNLQPTAHAHAGKSLGKCFSTFPPILARSSFPANGSEWPALPGAPHLHRVVRMVGWELTFREWLVGPGPVFSSDCPLQAAKAELVGQLCPFSLKCHL